MTESERAFRVFAGFFCAGLVVIPVAVELDVTLVSFCSMLFGAEILGWLLGQAATR